MADGKANTTIGSCELRKYISGTRKKVRAFNHRMNDAGIDYNLTDVPCEKCLKQIHKEGNELIDETRRLKKFCENHLNSNFNNCCCPHQSSDGDDAENIDICDDFNLKYLSKTRKTMRDYSDNLEDGMYENKDRGPCQTCKRDITNECDGLIEQLERLNDLQLVITESCKYGFVCVPLRQESGRRIDSHTVDSGIRSDNFDILNESPVAKEGPESHEAPGIDTEVGTKEESDDCEPLIECEGNITMSTEYSTVKEHEKGPYIILHIDSGPSSNQGSSTA